MDELQRARCGDGYGMGLWLQVFSHYKDVPGAQAQAAYIRWLSHEPRCRHKTHTRNSYRLQADRLQGQ